MSLNHNKIRANLYGWQSSTIDFYAQAFKKYGGSVAAHPDVLSFMMEHSELPIEFFHKTVADNIIGACFCGKSGQIEHPCGNNYPFSYDEIILPIERKSRVFLPVKSKKLSLVHQKNLLNTLFEPFNKRKVFQAKTVFSAKSQKNRRNELNRFQKAGGKVIPASAFSVDTLYDIYQSLFHARWQGELSSYPNDNLYASLRHLKHLIFGNVLMMKDVPCAYDLIFHTTTPKWIDFDVPNGGYDPAFAEFSPGSVLMWTNICDAIHLCYQSDKTMRFSIGQADRRWEYKSRWGEPHPLGRTFL